MNRWTGMGIEAYRAGNRQQAQRFLRYALMENPDDVRTLLWLVEVADTDAERERLLEKVVELDPLQVLARQALLDVQSRIRATHLPHVSPFEVGAGEIFEENSEPDSVEVRSTPPFMEALADRKMIDESPAPLPLVLPKPLQEKKWWAVALAVVVLIAVIVLFWALIRPF
jgi:hypothetical protein